MLIIEKKFENLQWENRKEKIQILIQVFKYHQIDKF